MPAFLHEPLSYLEEDWSNTFLLDIETKNKFKALTGSLKPSFTTSNAQYCFIIDLNATSMST